MSGRVPLVRPPAGSGFPPDLFDDGPGPFGGIMGGVGHRLPRLLSGGPDIVQAAGHRGANVGGPARCRRAHLGHAIGRHGLNMTRCLAATRTCSPAASTVSRMSAATAGQPPEGGHDRAGVLGQLVHCAPLGLGLRDERSGEHRNRTRSGLPRRGCPGSPGRPGEASAAGSRRRRAASRPRSRRPAAVGGRRCRPPPAADQ